MINIPVEKYKKIDTRVKSPRSVPENVSFLSFYRHRCSPGALGNHETRGGREARRRKFIKYLKVRKRLLSPAAINFHLHFIFVSFVTAREWNDVRTNDGGGGKKLQKEKGRRKVTEMPEGNIEERFDDGRRPLCA